MGRSNFLLCKNAVLMSIDLHIQPFADITPKTAHKLSLEHVGESFLTLQASLS